MIVGEDQRQSDQSVDNVTTEIVRDIAETSPPKSIETIKAAGDVAEHALIEERIRRRAYDLWNADGRPPGDGMDYWMRAEREIKQEK